VIKAISCDGVAGKRIPGAVPSRRRRAGSRRACAYGGMGPANKVEKRGSCIKPQEP
jgi:hypothetical protein